MMLTKVFQSGNSQAVRIPLSFRFNVDTVEILHGENGDVILRPTQVAKRGDQIFQLLQQFDEDFIECVAQRAGNEPPQEREAL